MVKPIIAQTAISSKRIDPTQQPWVEVIEQAVAEAPTGLLICELIQRKQRELGTLDDALLLLEGVNHG